LRFEHNERNVCKMGKLSFTTMATPGLGAVGSIKAARRYGYTGVDLRVSDYLGEITLNSTAREISDIRSAFLSEGIQVSGLLCYNEQGGKEEGSWSKMKESIIRHLEIANMLGSPAIRIFGGNPGDFKIHRDFIERTAEVISEVLSTAGSGTCILVQNHSDSFTAPEIAQLVEMVGSPELGMAYCPEHSYIMKDDMANMMPSMKGIIRQLYIADVIGVGNEHKSVLPGRGNVPVADVYQALGGSSFEGWVTFKWEKIWNKALEEPDKALPYFIEYFNNCLLK
jgi:sugar phosphate isomerase/epimerase